MSLFNIVFDIVFEFITREISGDTLALAYLLSRFAILSFELYSIVRRVPYGKLNILLLGIYGSIS